MAEKHGGYTSRTKARKRAADVLFEAAQKGLIQNPSAVRDLLADRQAVTAAPSPLPEYAIQIVEGVAGDLPAIDRALERHAKGSGLDRLPAVDVAVMRVAVWEMLGNQDQVPPITAIDEAVTIVKDLSTGDSPAYVNGVLDAVRKDIEAAPTAPAPAEQADAESEEADVPRAEVEEDTEIFDEY